MEEQPYVAAYVPDEQRDYEDAVVLAVEWIEQNGADRPGSGLLVTNVVDSANYTPSLRKFKDYHRNHITPRSSGTAATGLSTLAYVPYEEELALAGRHARGAALCVVESQMFPLTGWAAAVGAINLDTGEVAPAPGEEAGALLGRLEFYGNNAFGDQFGKKQARSILAELAATDPTLDGAYLAGWMIGKGLSYRAARNIRALTDGPR